jgi:ubiquinone/menaquinone biosynthesis C-methylase UbiE
MKKEYDVKKFYNDVSRNYSDHENRLCDKILDFFIKKNILQKFRKKGLDILDAGGGIGRFSWELSKKNDVVLSDISSGMIKKAKVYFNKNGGESVEFFEESVTEMKHSDKSFDVVLMMNAILDYCGDHKKAISEAHRVLKSGGLFIGSVNNRLIYCLNHEFKNKNFSLFKKTIETGNRKIEWGKTERSHMTHEFLLSELRSVLEKKFRKVKIIGPFSIVGKYKKYSKNESLCVFDIQVKYAENPDFILKSDDFMFVAEK